MPTMYLRFRDNWRPLGESAPPETVRFELLRRNTQPTDESDLPSQAVRSLSDIRFAEIRAPQMLVGQKGEEALDA